MGTFFDEQLRDTELQRLFAQEQLIEEATELVAGAMQDQGLTKSVLAARAGKTRPAITQLLAGSRNMTLRTLADLMYVMGLRVSLTAGGPEFCSEEEPISFASLPRHDRYRWADVEPVVCNDIRVA